MPRLYTGTTWQGTGTMLYHPIQGMDGDYVTQASLSRLYAQCFWDSTGEQIGDDINFTISATIFDTLQDTSDDARYEGDTGFNFRGLIPGAFYRPIPGSGGDDTLVTIFIHCVDTDGVDWVTAGWQVRAKQVFGLR